MKVISLWQPWATLMALGLKKIETRSWATKYRGPLAIHAATRISADQHAFFEALMHRNIFDSLGINHLKDLPHGGIIATLDLIDCQEITWVNLPGEPERMYGRYTPGRFKWITDNVKPFKKIIPLRGYQKIFNVPDEMLRVCKVCGCSQHNACSGGCAWVASDLCSQCAGEGIK